MMYGEEYRFGFNEQPDSMKRALQAARRAVDAGPSNHFAFLALAQALYFNKEFEAFRNAADRAIALNPMDGSTMEYLGHLIAFSGDWEYGCELAERARALNPNHPVWYWSLPFFNAYRKGDYVNARVFAFKFFMPGFYLSYVLLGAVHGQLGEREAGDGAVRDLLALIPDVAVIKSKLERWYQPELVEKLLDGLSKAGLEITSGSRTPVPSPAVTASGERPTMEGFWVAVLPFKYRGANADLEALAEGLSEDIVTGLSRFSYLRVIARSSTLHFTSESGDVRQMAHEIGARYVMEGSLRQAGKKLRLTVQLVDASTGAHLWAETYERIFDAESLFELQDDLVPCIVATIADIHGVLPRSMSELVLSREPEQMSPYEAVLRSFNYFQMVTPEELVAARSCLEMAVAKAPAYADAWAMLAVLFGQDYGQGFNLDADSLAKGLHAARRAVESGPSNHLAYFGLMQALFFQKEFQSFRNAAERAVALNPMDGNSLAFAGELLTYVGDSDRGLALSGRAKQLNPHHPGWYWYADFFNAYHRGDYQGALSFARKANLPNHWGMHAAIAAAAAQLGEGDVAAKAVRDLLKLRPEFAARVRKESEKWWQPELIEHFLEGLRKAGLEIADEDTSTSTLIPTRVNTRSVSGIRDSPSIAVLPFVNISNDPDNDYFCDGLAEELLNALSKIDDLKVAARTSAFSFKGKNANVSEIGEKLSVKNVLEGSVRRSGNRVRITTQLISAADGYHLWSERYDREMKDIFDVQDEITVAVVEALKIKLLGAVKAVVLKRHTSNPEAYEFYLRGLSYFSRFTPDGFQKAIDSFNSAVAIDPRYASAYAGLADAYAEMAFFSFSSEWMPKAKEAVKKALELDDALGEAHNSLAILKMYYDWDYAGAEQEFKRAVDLNPGSALIHNWYGWYLGLMGRFDESIQWLRRAQELDPLSESINSGLGIVFYWSGQSERAIEQFQKVLELNPTYALACSFLAEAYEQKSDFVSAIATAEKLEQAANDPLTLSSVAYVYAKSGERQKALEILNELNKRSDQQQVPAFTFAQIYAGLGDNEQAFAWLDKAYNERSVWLSFLKVDRKFDGLRPDPRYQELLRKMNFPQ
ncbi:MAG TPA: tetratricopeptide repeat protein, partial [Pyrinomonadaceae bacterium]|nr:tetratricopeptide repeat protein [Pyrinomonadaceae bacterium]